MTNIETTQGINDPEPTLQATPGPNQKPEFNGPVEAIKYHMAQQGLTQRDLIPMIGSRSKSLRSTFWDSDSYDAHGSCTPQASGRTS